MFLALPFFNILLLSALIIMREKRLVVNSRVSAKLSLGFYFQYYTMFTTATKKDQQNNKAIKPTLSRRNLGLNWSQY